jgi:hypothetical protein
VVRVGIVNNSLKIMIEFRLALSATVVDLRCKPSANLRLVRYLPSTLPEVDGIFVVTWWMYSARVGS